MTVTSVSQKHDVQSAAKSAAAKKTDVINIQMTSGKAEKGETKQTSKVEQNFNKDLKTGKLKQDEFNVKILGFTVSKKLDGYIYKPAKGETYGQISTRYGLPEGTLRGQALAEGNSGNLNICTPEGEVYLDGETIRNAIAVSKENKKNQH